MYEGIYEREFTEKFELFRQKIPAHLAEVIDDLIGWLVLDMDSSELNQISDDRFVWKKPEHINCPEIYVLFRVDEENNTVYIEDFYDFDMLNEAIFFDPEDDLS